MKGKLLILATLFFDYCVVNSMLWRINLDGVWVSFETVMFTATLLFLAVVELGLLGFYFYIHNAK